MGAGGEVPDFHGKVDISLQGGPGDKVAKLRSVELRMEAKVRSGAGVRICGLVAVVRAGYHEPGLTGAQILYEGEYSSNDISRFVFDRDAQPVALVHQQGAAVRSGARDVQVVGTRRAGGHPIALHEHKVRLLSAIGIELSIIHLFKTVYVQRLPPVGQLATHLVDKGAILGCMTL